MANAAADNRQFILRARSDTGGKWAKGHRIEFTRRGQVTQIPHGLRFQSPRDDDDPILAQGANDFVDAWIEDAVVADQRGPVPAKFQPFLFTPGFEQTEQDVIRPAVGEGIELLNQVIAVRSRLAMTPVSPHTLAKRADFVKIGPDAQAGFSPTPEFVKV